MSTTIAIFGGHHLMRLGLAHVLTRPDLKAHAPDGDMLAWLQEHRVAAVMWLGPASPDDKHLAELASLYGSNETVVIALIDELIPGRAASLLAMGVHPMLLDQNPTDLVHSVQTSIQGRVTLPMDLLRAIGGAADGASLPYLTPRDLALLRMLADQVPGKAIARELGCDERTVYRRADDLYERLGTPGSRTDASARATELGLLARQRQPSMQDSR